MTQADQKPLDILIDVVDTLIPHTIKSLFVGEALDRERWHRAARAYEALLVMQGDFQTDALPNQVHAIGEVARVVTASTLQAVGQNTEQEHATSEGGAIELLRQALVAKRMSEFTGPAQAAAFYELGTALYALIPYYATESDMTPLALRQVIETYHRSIELYAQQDSIETALGPVTNLVALSNELAAKFNIPDYMESALDWSEQVLHANGTDNFRNQLGLAALASNVIRTCRWLAKAEPPKRSIYLEKALRFAQWLRDSLNVTAPYRWLAQAVHPNRSMYLEKALHFARRLREILDDSRASTDQPEAWNDLNEHCMLAFVNVHAELAIANPKRFDRCATKAWQYARDFEALANNLQDPAMHVRADQILRSLLELLRGTQPDWIPPDAEKVVMPGFVPQDERNATSFGESLRSELNRSQEIAQQIIALSEPFKKRSMITTTLDAWYASLSNDLAIVVSEIGLNYHACRLLLALGAIASARLGTLSHLAVMYWMLGTEQANELPPDYRREVLRRQQLTSQHHFAVEQGIWLRIIALAALAHTLRQDTQLAEVLPFMLHERNVLLLRQVLQKGSTAQVIELGRQRAADDLRFFFRSLPQDTLVSALRAYDPMLGVGREEELPAPGHLPFRRRLVKRPHGTSPVPADTSEASVPEERQSSAKQEKVGDLPTIQYQFDAGTEERLRNKPFVTAEDYVGATLINNGIPHRIESILGMGQQKVVFGVANMTTGERFALAMRRADFDPRSSLLRRLDQALREHLHDDPDLIIRLCEQLLELNPREEMAAYNKGVALMIKKDFEQALDCFDLAVSLQPSDSLNWLYKSLMLAELNRHSEAVAHFARATSIDPEGMRSYIDRAPADKALLKRSARELLRQSGDREDAVHILSEFLM